MTPKLAAALQDESIRMALKRLYNLRRFEELSAPLELIATSTTQLDLSIKQLGERYVLVTSVFDEYKPIREKELADIPDVESEDYDHEYDPFQDPGNN